MSSPRRVLRAIERSERAGHPGRAHGASVGVRSRSAARSTAAGAAFRALLPPGRFPRRACARCSRARVRPDRADIAHRVQNSVSDGPVGLARDGLFSRHLADATAAAQAHRAAPAPRRIDDRPAGSALARAPGAGDAALPPSPCAWRSPRMARRRARARLTALEAHGPDLARAARAAGDRCGELAAIAPRTARRVIGRGSRFSRSTPNASRRDLARYAVQSRGDRRGRRREAIRVAIGGAPCATPSAPARDLLSRAGAVRRSAGGARRQPTQRSPGWHRSIRRRGIAGGTCRQRPAGSRRAAARWDARGARIDDVDRAWQAPRSHRRAMRRRPGAADGEISRSMRRPPRSASRSGRDVTARSAPPAVRQRTRWRRISSTGATGRPIRSTSAGDAVGRRATGRARSLDRRAARRRRLRARRGDRPRACAAAADRRHRWSSISTTRPRRCSPTAATCRPRGRCRSARSSRATSSSSARRTRWCGTTSPHARMEQHFRPTVADPGYDVVTENRYFVERRRHRVGGAVVFGERLEVGRRPAAVSAAAAREGAVAAAAAAIRRGLPLRLAGTERVDGSTATSCGSSRCATTLALSRHGLDRSRGRSRACACRRCRAACRRRWSRTRRRSTTRRSPTIGGRPVFLFTEPDRAADSARRRPQHARREEGRVHDFE